MHDCLNLQSDFQIPEKVYDLWLPNSRKWDENKTTTLFGQQTFQNGMNIMTERDSIIGGTDMPVLLRVWEKKNMLGTPACVVSIHRPQIGSMHGCNEKIVYSASYMSFTINKLKAADWEFWSRWWNSRDVFFFFCASILFSRAFWFPCRNKSGPAQPAFSSQQLRRLGPVWIPPILPV